MTDLDGLLKGLKQLEVEIQRLKEENTKLRKMLGQPVSSISSSEPSSEPSRVINGAIALIALLKSGQWDSSVSLRELMERKRI